MKSLLVVGDALLDRDVQGAVHRLCPDAPAPVLDEERSLARPGGAALAAALAASDGREVTLLTALGEDGAGHELGALLEDHGVEVVDLGLSGATPEKVRVRDGERTIVRVDRGGPPAQVGALSAAGRAAIGWAEAILVADYGRGITAAGAIRDSLAACRSAKPVVWDPHPRGSEPLAGITLATPNREEALALTAREAPDERPAALARDIARRWAVRQVCVTCGPDGAVLAGAGGPPQQFPAPTAVLAGDPCGAGDRFSSALAGALADGLEVAEAAATAVARASSFVADGGAASWAAPPWPEDDGAMWLPTPTGEEALVSLEQACALATRVRAYGGVVVAAGGCFDLLHAGHVSTLAAARSLGDCLIVCLNSDASVRRLKGPARPLVGERDRAAVLSALGCVDAVTLFDEDTPERMLERLRPAVWAKGGDYAAEDLPERAVLERWGGRVVTMPYVDGRSTTRLMEEVAYRGAS